MIAPTFQQLSQKFAHVQFLKVDVDKVPQIAGKYNVRAMPTFIVIKGGKVVGEMKGANPAGLSSMVSQHAGPVPAANASSSTGASSSQATPTEPGVESLLPHLHSPHITCLNESSSHGIKSIVGSDAGRKGSGWLESEVDPELLIHLPFNQPVKIKSISIFSAISPSQAPKTIQLFINHPNLDFSDASNLTPTQEIVLTEKDVKGERVDVRFVKFQSVNSLSILVKDNQGDEETTRIDSLDVFGSADLAANYWKTAAVALPTDTMALQAINSNVSRLTQRITENFKESTRDIPLFQGNSNSSAAYFEYNHDKLKDISWLLEGGGDKAGTGTSGVSAVTSRMSGDAARLEGMKRLIAGKSLFAQLAEQYLNDSTFDEMITGILMIGLKKLAVDRNPWVRKTVALGLPKVYERICRLLVDADEWGQAIALDILIRYARAMLENPESSGNTQSPKVEKSNVQDKPANGKQAVGASYEDEDMDELDPDIELLLHCAIPLFQSRNPAVVLGTIRLFYLIAPASHEEIGQDKLVRPLIRLMNGLGSAEVRAIATEVCRQIAEERPSLLSSFYASFLLHSTDSIRMKRTKIRILIALLSADNADMLIREFQEYIRFPETDVSEDAIKAVGHCARIQSSTRKLALGILIKLLNSARVAKLVRQLPEITNGSARSCVYWLAGQYAEDNRGDTQVENGYTFEGLQPWAPDTLRIGAKQFTREPSLAKLQILTLAAKLLVICPTARPMHALATYIFNLARYDEDWDVRDRSRFLRGLLRSICSTSTVNGNDDGGLRDNEEGDTGGVVLRREQIRMVLLAAKETVASDVEGEERRQRELAMGTLSSLALKPLPGYEALAEWTDDPTDTSLRDVIEETPIRPVIASRQGSFQPANTPQGVSSPVFASVGGSPASAGVRQRIPAVQAKSRFKNLDDFLNESESEEDEESEEEEITPAAEAESGGESSEDSEATSEDESTEEDHTLITSRS
ncbi:hypothetical protein QFC19_004466 [Naganishia cerealis]|uniref:Uncharacterized protein n=1 Tax=Naganishia cerealis TaxID=610337 RepID=A0ACC2VY84_9TREE|nr:hypothetical protein QFC19_004466 [Naganishia cerealis]